MTLAKAAPADWAKWFAQISGLPVDHVREKLKNGGFPTPESGSRAYNESGPGGACDTFRDLTENPWSSEPQEHRMYKSIPHEVAQILASRILARSRVTDSGCVVPGGTIHPISGYARATLTLDGVHYDLYAHRVVYTAQIGPVPEGLTLDHLCFNPSCVNPYHLEPVTEHENILRSDGPSARNARKTHCPEGHELPPFVPGKDRRCAPCARDYRRRTDRHAARARAERGLPSGDPRHGTKTGYNYWGCRCDACKTAQRQKKAS